jgi:hypothetical protein
MMKKIVRIFVVAALLVAFSCKKEEKKIDEDTKPLPSFQESAKVPKTKVEFDRLIHDFGEFEQGKVVETVFTIKNVGDKDLYIVDAYASCGCTVPEVTKEAIKPGESAPIKVKFDSNGKSGEVTKTVNVRCNTPKIIEQIKIKASIKTKKSSAITKK